MSNSTNGSGRPAMTSVKVPMNRNKKLIIIIIIIAAVAAAGIFAFMYLTKYRGNYGFELDSSVLYVESDKSIISIYVEPFDESYYNIGDLQSQAKSDVNGYDGITLLDVSKTDDNAVVQIRYTSTDIYDKYNNEKVNPGGSIKTFLGTVSEAEAAGYDLGDMVKAVAGAGDSTMVDITNETTSIRINGDILGTGGKAETDEKTHVVTTSGGVNDVIFFNFKAT